MLQLFSSGVDSGVYGYNDIPARSQIDLPPCKWQPINAIVKPSFHSNCSNISHPSPHTLYTIHHTRTNRPPQRYTPATHTPQSPHSPHRNVTAQRNTNTYKAALLTTLSPSKIYLFRLFLDFTTTRPLLLFLVMLLASLAASVITGTHTLLRRPGA